MRAGTDALSGMRRATIDRDADARVVSLDGRWQQCSLDRFTRSIHAQNCVKSPQPCMLSANTHPSSRPTIACKRVNACRFPDRCLRCDDARSARETLRCRHVDKPGGCCGISHLWHAHGPCLAQPDLHCACFILAMRAALCADHFGAPLLPDLPAPSAGGHDWRKRYRGACACFWTKPFDEQDPEVLSPTISASTGTPLGL